MIAMYFVSPPPEVSPYLQKHSVSLRQISQQKYLNSILMSWQNTRWMKELQDGGIYISILVNMTWNSAEI